MVSQDLKEISVEEADTAELLLLYSYLLKQESNQYDRISKKLLTISSRNIDFSTRCTLWQGFD